MGHMTMVRQLLLTVLSTGAFCLSPDNSVTGVTGDTATASVVSYAAVGSPDAAAAAAAAAAQPPVTCADPEKIASFAAMADR